MRFALGLAVLALVVIGLAWSWWHITGRARRAVRVARTSRQVMIDVSLSAPGGDGVDEIRQRRR